MKTTEIFSDISRSHRGYATCYCCAERRVDENRVLWHCGHLDSGHNSALAEIMALAKAASICRISDRLILYTDLNDLPPLFAGQIGASWLRGRNAKVLYDLKQAASRHAASECRMVNRAHFLYRQCHRDSKAAAKHRERAILKMAIGGW